MKIKVGYADYEVRGMSPLLSDADSCEGMCKTADQVIFIRTDRTPQAQACTLIHEMMHAAFDAFQLPRKKLDEEAICRALEIPLSNLIRDNPKLIEALQKALAGEKPIVK
jgi:hypothetical protein